MKCGVTQLKVATGMLEITSVTWRRWIFVCRLTYQTSLSSPRINYPLITISSEAFAQSENPIDMDLKLNTFLAVGIVATIGLITGCGGSTSKPSIGTDINYSFAQNIDGWEFGYSDYTTLTKPTDVEHIHTISPIQGASKALYMSGTNESSSLLLYTTRKVNGLLPKTIYKGKFTVTFASDTPAGCAGVGGSPGESVWLIGAVTDIKPENTQQGDTVQLNISRGNQSTEGDSSAVLGTIGVPDVPCTANNRQAVIKTLGPSKWISFRTDNTGSAWILVGIDSGALGNSRIWLEIITFTYEPR